MHDNKTTHYILFCSFFPSIGKFGLDRYTPNSKRKTPKKSFSIILTLGKEEIVGPNSKRTPNLKSKPELLPIKDHLLVVECYASKGGFHYKIYGKNTRHGL